MRRARASLLLSAAYHLIAQFREEFHTHLHKGFFVINKEDSFRACGDLVVTDRIDFRSARNPRKIDSEDGPYAGFALDGNGAVVLRDNAVDHGQAEARPFSDLLRREEGVEYPVHDVGRHAGARVADDEPHITAGLHPVRVVS